MPPPTAIASNEKHNSTGRNVQSGSPNLHLRSVICTVLGHVDHGKSSILDKIRGTSFVSSEPGQITQAIGASLVPVSVIKKLCS
ncbi:MAG TPA: hypothetical protein VI934_04420, partial [Candidatus Nanoarchaeia archaeon]|nr:hypothetical protein [Candidatus Nanoarchaeia archaeon]